MLVLAVHTSRSPASTAAVGRLRDRVEELAGVRPEVGCPGRDFPALRGIVARHPGAVVVPLLLGEGRRLVVDVPLAVRNLNCVITDGLSGEPGLALALHERLTEAERRSGGRADATVVASAGSTGPGGNDGTHTVVAQLSLLRDAPVIAAYCAARGLTVARAVQRLRSGGHRRIAVATHLLAPGRCSSPSSPRSGRHRGAV